MQYLSAKPGRCTSCAAIVTVAFVLAVLAIDAGASVARTKPADLSASEAAASLPPIVVTRDAADGPAGCSARQVATFVSRFFDDFNQGRRRRLASRLALAATTRDVARDAADGRFGFRWYSVTTAPGKHFAAYDRSTLLKYFRRRHLKNERLRLVMIDVAPGGTARYTAAITFVLLREADDLPVTVEAYGYGKATLNCAPTSIAVWSMSGPQKLGLTWPCPQPNEWTPGTIVVACTRE